MGKTERAGLGIFLLVIFAVLAGLGFAKGGLYTGRHEGDALHLMGIVLREAQGQWPHLDFQTPIGLFATAPIAFFVRHGLGIGHGFLAAQALMAALALPAIWHVAASRLPRGWAYLFGAYVLALFLALVHGETVSAVSVSMYYNRWAWGLAYLAILPAVLLPQGAARPGRVDGLVIGLALAALALIKVTYLVSFLPAILLALILRRAWSTMALALVAGLAVAAAVTLRAGGLGFWSAYLGDLMTVAASPVRPNPGLPLGQVIGSPEYLGGSVVLFLAVILLRQARRSVEGMALLLLAPGFFYVQYQNWGNDPQWLMLLALLLLALRPVKTITNGLGWDLSQAIGVAAIAGLAFAAPSAINLVWSPLRHLSASTADSVPLVPGSGVNEDLQTARVRARRVNALSPLDDRGGWLEGRIAESARAPVTEWNGEAWPDCELTLGYSAWYQTMAADLTASGLVAGKAIFSADALQSPWLFGAGVPLKRGAPWYYGGLAGIENADLLLVPRCAVHSKARGLVLDALTARGIAPREVRRTEMYVLYAL